MKAKGKVRQVINPISGKEEWSQYPVTYEEAILEEVAKYWPMTPCPTHGGRPVYFTVTRRPGCCVHPAAVEAYNEATRMGEPRTILEAKQKGLVYYWQPQPHPLCGHPGKILLNGKCAFCKDERDNSPRQVALNKGETWYMPLSTDPCTNGHVAPRRVNNGSCKQCEDEKRVSTPSTEEDQTINKLCPDLIISRTDAKALGYKVYRTGEPCRAGHKGWRYVSTCNCLDCR